MPNEFLGSGLARFLSSGGGGGGGGAIPSGGGSSAGLLEGPGVTPDQTGWSTLDSSIATTIDPGGILTGAVTQVGGVISFPVSTAVVGAYTDRILEWTLADLGIGPADGTGPMDIVEIYVRPVTWALDWGVSVGYRDTTGTTQLHGGLQSQTASNLWRLVAGNNSFANYPANTFPENCFAGGVLLLQPYAPGSAVALGSGTMYGMNDTTPASDAYSSTTVSTVADVANVTFTLNVWRTAAVLSTTTLEVLVGYRRFPYGATQPF